MDLDLPWLTGTPSQVKLVLSEGALKLDSLVLTSPESSCLTGTVRRCRATLQAEFTGTNPASVMRKWLSVAASVTSGGVTKTSTDSVEVVVVDRRDSPYGSGWWPAAFTQLVDVGNDRVLVSPTGGAGRWHGSLVEDQKDASGKLFRRNRFYDPVTGRFTQEDPLGLAGGLNAYGFGHGDPVNFGDPFGLCPKHLTGRPCLWPIAGGNVGLRKSRSNSNIGRFGMTRNGGTRAHQGVDLLADKGTAVHAADEGLATATQAETIGVSPISCWRAKVSETRCRCHCPCKMRSSISSRVFAT